MFYYSDETAKESVSYIKGQMKEFPCSVSSEIQDYGGFLLLTVELIEPPNLQRLEETRATLKKYFSSTFPRLRHQYTWMIILKLYDTVIDSIMDDIG